VAATPARKPTARKPTARTPTARTPVASKAAARGAPAPVARPVRGGASRPGAGLRDRRGAWTDVVASQDEQYRLKRNAVLREAARAFNARGFHNTSLDDVAAVLGVTKAALYYYVRSKQEILYECHMMAYDLGAEALAYARAHGRDGLERAGLVARRFIELYTGEMGRFAVLSEHDALDGAQRAAVLARRDAFDHALRDLVEEGIADGSIRAVDAKLAVLFLMGAVNWMATRWFRPDGPLSATEIAAGFEDMFLAAIGARRAARRRAASP
jgi:AcrR family transcriptional regulator